MLSTTPTSDLAGKIWIQKQNEVETWGRGWGRGEGLFVCLFTAGRILEKQIVPDGLTWVVRYTWLLKTGWSIISMRDQREVEKELLRKVDTCIAWSQFTMDSVHRWLQKEAEVSKMTQYKKGWRDGSAVKSTDYSSEGPEFKSHNYMVAHNHP